MSLIFCGITVDCSRSIQWNDLSSQHAQSVEYKNLSFSGMLWDLEVWSGDGFFNHCRIEFKSTK